MKHLAIIQSEFVKEARKWDDLSLDEQRAYLKRHRKSKRRLTARPKREVSGEDTQEHSESIKSLLQNEPEGDGDYAIRESFPDKSKRKYKELFKQFNEHYGKSKKLPKTDYHIGVRTWNKDGNEIILSYKKYSKNTVVSILTKENKELEDADQKLVKGLKTFDFDMSHTSPKRMVNRIIKLKKKYPKQLFSVGEGPHGGVDPDGMTLMVIPTKEHKKAVLRSGDWGPEISKVDSYFISDLKSLAQHREGEMYD